MSEEFSNAHAFWGFAERLRRRIVPIVRPSAREYARWVRARYAPIFRAPLTVHVRPISVLSEAWRVAERAVEAQPLVLSRPYAAIPAWPEIAPDAEPLAYTSEESSGKATRYAPAEAAPRPAPVLPFSVAEVRQALQRAEPSTAPVRQAPSPAPQRAPASTGAPPRSAAQPPLRRGAGLAEEAAPRPSARGAPPPPRVERMRRQPEVIEGLTPRQAPGRPAAKPPAAPVEPPPVARPIETHTASPRQGARASPLPPMEKSPAEGIFEAPAEAPRGIEAPERPASRTPEAPPTNQGRVEGPPIRREVSEPTRPPVAREPHSAQHPGAPTPASFDRTRSAEGPPEAPSAGPERVSEEPSARAPEREPFIEAIETEEAAAELKPAKVEGPFAASAPEEPSLKQTPRGEPSLPRERPPTVLHRAAEAQEPRPRQERPGPSGREAIERPEYRPPSRVDRTTLTERLPREPQGTAEDGTSIAGLHEANAPGARAAPREGTTFPIEGEEAAPAPPAGAVPLERAIPVRPRGVTGVPPPPRKERGLPPSRPRLSTSSTPARPMEIRRIPEGEEESPAEQPIPLEQALFGRPRQRAEQAPPSHPSLGAPSSATEPPTFAGPPSPPVGVTLIRRQPEAAPTAEGATAPPAEAQEAPQAGTEVDLEKLTDEVYRRIRERLRLERERSGEGFSRWR